MRDWIVVVDDEPLSLSSAKALLGPENMKISCLRSGKDLLKFMSKNEPDLILMDVLMPEMDGFETLEMLRKWEKEEGKLETPVIFLTGDADDDMERRGLKLGASDYIHKPFNKDVLIRRIKNTILNNRKIESLTEHATIDKLTGFLNKSSGIERITDVCGRLDGMLMILDLDSFKLVNDLFGHEMGDQVLASFADIVKTNVRSEDIVCRIGGDEFMAFLSNMSDESAVRNFTDRLNRQLTAKAKRLMGTDHGIPLGISIGAVRIPEFGREYEVLFKMADAGLYLAKQNGRHCCNVYSSTVLSSETELSPKEELERLTRIIEERNEGREALILGSDAFSAVYHFIRRFNKRYEGKAMKLLMIITLKETCELTIEEVAASFGDVLKSTLRRSDIILQSKSNQFFMLLPMMEEPNAARVVERIMSRWQETPEYKWCSIKYDMEIC